MNIPSNWKEEAISEQTPAARLDFLAGINAELARLVAGNPNTSPDVLWRLAKKFPDEFFKNTILPLLFLENPNCILEQPLGVLLTLLKEHIVPEWFLLEATRHKDSRVLLAVAKNPQITDKIIAKLIEKNRQIQLYLASNPNISYNAIELLYQTKTSDYEARLYIREAVAKHPHTPIKVLEKLAFDAEHRIKKAVASLLWNLSSSTAKKS